MRRTPLPPDALDETDRKLINRLQDGFPLTSHPFAGIAQEMGLEEADVLTRIANLRELGAITRFGPFIDAAAMGGAFCLCAMEVPEDRFEEVMTLVNAHAEVAHNYERVHRLNMWFVLACDRPEGIDETADRIEAETGLTVLRFPKLKEFFIGFRVTA
ncbi:Lrp/AsnC family transcriptional regulator [Rhodalgimonas zhirmunskyi]|uniref:Siroheme decarboxylase NirG subunit n=1 Tax=Rhodalgimonas zhirmunskyi TaxID=2964767 RepID=A0AAJ1U997_9RHOB|nr:AsnC family transcriptional regulator [Rhodoalgimonas zhirmunskyi]MDQ2095135.1 AsnC family transcriptional regulator [Rhodoalgimonas zhirmunskyi]